MKIPNVKALLLLALASLSVQAADRTPITIKVSQTANPKHVVEFFWSPSGRHCAITFAKVITPLLSHIMHSESSNIQLVSHPVMRDDKDLDYLRIMECVPPENSLLVMTKLLLNTASKPDPLTANEFEAIASQHGLDAACLAKDVDEENYLAGISYLVSELSLTSTPVLVVDGKVLTETYFLWQFKEKLKENGIELGEDF